MSAGLQQYTVGLKLLLEHDGKFLFLRVPRKERYWDLPGGRINTDEVDLPLTEILKREVREELGLDVQFSIGAPALQFRRFLEHKNVHVFLSVYRGTYVSGDITLSDEHTSFEWLTPTQLLDKPEGFFNREEFDAVSACLGQKSLVS